MRRSMTPWLLAAALILVGALLVSMGIVPGFMAPALGIPPVAEAGHEPEGAPPASPPAPDTTTADRQLALARKEAELEAREGHLREREVEVALKVLAMDRQQSEAEAVLRVAQLYEAMPPYRAGPMLQALDQGLAVQVLRLVDPDQAAAVLAYMDPARAAEITRQLMKP